MDESRDRDRELGSWRGIGRDGEMERGEVWRGERYGGERGER